MGSALNEPSSAGVGLEPEEAPASDGRRRRRQQSRQRILRALVEALAEPDFDLTPEQIAVRSGYSVSTIFRHFGGRDDLIDAMQKLSESRVVEILEVGPYEGEVRARVAELVRRLTAIFGLVAPMLRWVQPDRQRSVGDRGRLRLDAVVRSQIVEALGEELASRPADTLELFATVLSVGAWSHLRVTRGHDADRAAALLESAVLRLLGEPIAS